ncbi:MAG: MurT ligase domain-containing protein [Candidatus Saccharimonadales bacterium]
MIPHKHVVTIGKAIRHASRLRGGSGSALPGLVIEKLDPKFAARVLSELPQGVVIITGTNGKTTTTKIVCKLLTDHGYKVFTNRTGSNFTRGIIASILAETNHTGMLDADIAVLELDEAYAAHFVKLIRPRYSLLLNVMRDQLDRFGEIDHTAKLLKKVALATVEAVILNRDDPLIRAITNDLPTTVSTGYFGISSNLKSLFPSDQDLYGAQQTQSSTLPAIGNNDVVLEKLNGHKATFSFGKKTLPATSLKIDGVYNAQNAAAALALVRAILDEAADADWMLGSLAAARPAFGRGEAIEINGHPLEIVLVKNPAGFRLALGSYASRPARTMIAINDNYADGRDMSWLWDVNFSELKKVDVVSGIRAYDMALRLQYDDVEVGHVDTSLAKSLSRLLNGKPGARRIFCTYTAMMSLRKLLQKSYDLEDIDA